jgi:hypothetical protein
MVTRTIRRAWIAVLVLSVALAPGCTTRLAYNNADFLIERYVDGYVEFDGIQQADFDRRLDDLLAWHRDRELPAYVAWIGRVRAGVASGGGVTDAEVRAWTDELLGFWGRVGRRLAPELVALAGTLTDEQVDALLERLREGQAERVERWSDRTPEARIERRVRGMERFLERWAGSLSDAQEARIEEWASRIVPTTELWLANREGWIEELGAALRSRSDTQALEAAVERLFVEPSVRWNDAYREAIEVNSALTSGLLADFIDGLEPRQRARADERLGDLQADLAVLVTSS